MNAELDLGLPPPAPKKPRARDLTFEAMADACAMDLTQITSSARGALNRALREIREVRPDLTPEAIRLAVSFYRSLHPSWPVTAPAIAKHWPELTRAIDQHHATLPPNVRRFLTGKL